MVQSRFSKLVILSNESDMVKDVDFDEWTDKSDDQGN